MIRLAYSYTATRNLARADSILRGVLVMGEALPANPECDQIGTWPVGCSGVANSPEPHSLISRIFLGPWTAGYHRLRWPGDDDAGRPLAGGVYFYRLTAGETNLSRRLVLIR